jgi:hypothetical protein
MAIAFTSLGGKKKEVRMAYYTKLRWCINRMIVGPFGILTRQLRCDFPALLAL